MITCGDTGFGNDATAFKLLKQFDTLKVTRSFMKLYYTA